MSQGDQETRRNKHDIYSLAQVVRDNDGMVGSRRSIASKVGVAVVGGREMRAAADDRDQPRVTLQARDDCNKKQKSRKRNNPHHVRDRCICSYHSIVHVPYRTLQNIVRRMVRLHAIWTRRSLCEHGQL